MKQIIILDFDDTLIVNEDLDFQSFRIISKKLKCYIPKKSEIASLRSKGYLASDIIDFIIKKSKNSITKIKFSENRIFFLESIESIKFLKIRPYAKKFIKKFKKNNFKIVIATLRKNENTLRFFLKKEGIISYIDQIYCNTNFTLDGRIPSNAYKIKKNIFSKILSKNFSRVISIGNSDIDEDTSNFFKIEYVNINLKNQKYSYFRDLYEFLSD